MLCNCFSTGLTTGLFKWWGLWFTSPSSANDHHMRCSDREVKAAHAHSFPEKDWKSFKKHSPKLESLPPPELWDLNVRSCSNLWVLISFAVTRIFTQIVWTMAKFNAFSQIIILWPNAIISIHSSLDLMKVSGIAYIKSRMSLDLSKCKPSGPYWLAQGTTFKLPSHGITRCVFAEWKRVQKMCPLARTHVLLIKNIYEYIFNFFF